MNAGPTNACANCGAELPAAARFCPACGVAAASSGEPVRAETMQTEYGTSESSERVYSEPRVFGAVPGTATLLLGLVAFLLGLVVLILGHLLVGLVLVALGIGGLALFVERSRGRSEGRLGRATSSGLTRLRERAVFLFGSADAWSRAGREVIRLRAELRRLEQERRRTQYDLGVATYEQDTERTTSLREHLHGLHERASECVREIEAATARARERVARDRRTIQPTIVAPLLAGDSSEATPSDSDPHGRTTE